MTGNPTAYHRNIFAPHIGKFLKDEIAPAVYLAGMIGWMLQVPLFWVRGGALGGDRGIPPGLPSAVFAVGGLLGVVLGPSLILRFPRRRRMMLVASVLVNLVLTLVGPFAPTWMEPVGTGVLAVATVIGLIGAYGWFSGVVTPERAGRVISATVVGVVVIYGLIHLGLSYLSAARSIAASLPLLVAATVVLLPRGARMADSPADSSSVEGSSTSIAHMVLSIGMFALVGGVSMQHLLRAGAIGHGANLLTYGAFIIGAVASGLWLDYRGMQQVTVMGAGWLVVSFMVDQWSTGAAAQAVVAVLNGAAFGILEPIPWCLLLRTLRTNKTALWISLGVGLLLIRTVVGIVALPWLDQRFLEAVGLPGALAVLVAILLIQGVADPRTFLQRWKQTAPLGPEEPGPTPEAVPAVTAAELLERYYGDKLSKREIQIGRLAVSGTSTREIAEQLFLTVSTVKTHLKSLYRKTDTENRNDLYRKLIDSEFGEKPRGPAGASDLRTAVDTVERDALPRDPVTGAVEQAAFESFVLKEMTDARMHKTHMALVFIRLSGPDGKVLTLNRGEWHQMLTVAAGILRASLRASDTVFRWNNHEFLVVIPWSGKSGGQEVADRLAQKITAWAGARYSAVAVVGCASTDEDANCTPQTLLEAAIARTVARTKA